MIEGVGVLATIARWSSAALVPVGRLLFSYVMPLFPHANVVVVWFTLLGIIFLLYLRSKQWPMKLTVAAIVVVTFFVCFYIQPLTSHYNIAKVTLADTIADEETKCRENPRSDMFTDTCRRAKELALLHPFDLAFDSMNEELRKKLSSFAEIKLTTALNIMLITFLLSGIVAAIGPIAKLVISKRGGSMRALYYEKLADRSAAIGMIAPVKQKHPPTS